MTTNDNHGESLRLRAGLVVRAHSGEPFPQVRALKPKPAKITLTGNSPRSQRGVERGCRLWVG